MQDFGLEISGSSRSFFRCPYNEHPLWQLPVLPVVGPTRFRTARSRTRFRKKRAVRNRLGVAQFPGGLASGPVVLTGRQVSHVVHLDRLMIDSAWGRGDPASEFAGLDDRTHEGADKLAVRGGREPLPFACTPFGLGHRESFRCDVYSLELADRATESAMRQSQTKVHS